MIAAIGIPQADVDSRVMIGDAMLICGAMCWAGTTLVFKATRLVKAPAEKASVEGEQVPNGSRTKPVVVATRPDTGRSMIMYRAGYRAEALRLGRDLRIHAVGPLDGLRTSDLMGAHLALVVG